MSRQNQDIGDVGREEPPKGLDVWIVGSGKLASELLNNLKTKTPTSVSGWSARGDRAVSGIVVHAGSGRELAEVVSFCSRSQSILLQVSTESSDFSSASFPVVVCPNLNFLMLKFLAMLASGAQFQGYEKHLVESHQATKVSAPGTALQMARALGMAPEEVVSIRNPEIQTKELGIPAPFLDRHAFHRITIADDHVQITMETKALGQAPYAEGLARIIDGIRVRRLEPRVYHVLELLDRGWI